MREKEIIKKALPIIEKLIDDEVLYGYKSDEENERDKTPVDEHSQVIQLLDGLRYWLEEEFVNIKDTSSGTNFKR